MNSTYHNPICNSSDYIRTRSDHNVHPISFPVTKIIVPHVTTITSKTPLTQL